MKVRVPLSMLLLIILNGCLATAVGWRLLEGSLRQQLLHAEAAGSDVTFSAIDAPAVGNIDIQARPIFHQSRSFYVAPPPQVVQQPPPEYRLTGSMSIAGKSSAVLIHGVTGARTSVSLGDEVEGWTVAAIEPGKVTLQFADRVAEITSRSSPQGRGVTVVGAQASNQTSLAPAPGTNGVRVLGNSSSSAPTSQSATNDSANPAPRLYRPPSP